MRRNRNGSQSIALLGDGVSTTILRRLPRERDGGVAQRELRHAIKYSLVGVSNVSIDFALYAVLVSLGVWYPLAKTLSLMVATGNGYTLNRLWTFRAGGHRNAILAKYVVTQLGCLVINLTLLTGLIEIAGLGQIMAQAVALPFVALTNFLAQRLWTFGYAVR